MSGKTRTSLLSLTIIAVILFSAFGPTIAYADGGTTPETPPAEATTTPDEASTEKTSEGEATEVTLEATPEAAAATEEATAEADSAGAEAAPEESAAQPTKEAAPVVEEAAVAPAEPVLTEVPENTTVTVVDANGESQPLATQEAAAAIATSDPIWCPEGASPAPGANGCTGSFTSFDELLTFLSGNPAYQGAGTIYVEQGDYQGNDPGGVIDFNAPTYDLSNIRNSNLTVTGGWNPSDGSTTSTSDFTDTRILIGSSASPWGGSVSVNNVTMTFSNDGPEIPATPENALTIVSQGEVELTNVDISNAPSAGVEIDAGGGVTIENSNFHRNKTAGAVVRATGSVTIVDSEFQNPLVNRQRRQIVGLDVNSGGAVTLQNVLANGNREVGTNIVAGDAVTIDTASFNGTMELEGPRNAPTAFLGYGLQVQTPGEITLANIVANNNFLWGARLDAGGRIAIVDSIFNANTTESPGFIDDTGLFIINATTVALTNVQANDNRLYGAQINASGNVSINGSTFNNNRGVTNTGTGDTYDGHGLHITTLADIFINNSDASGNMLFGGELSAGGLVAIFGSTFNNNSTGVSANAVGKGLGIVSGGLTDLFQVTLDNNQTDGADIQAGGSASLGSVVATNNGEDGVAVQTSCAHVDSGTYSGNGQYGLNLGTSALNLLTPPTFSNNGAGDINPASPPTCSFATTSTATTTEAANIFTSAEVTSTSQSADSNEDVGSDNVSLNQFMASSKTAQGHIFVGKYAYVDTDAGLQIFALVPSSDVLAME